MTRTSFGLGPTPLRVIVDVLLRVVHFAEVVGRAYTSHVRPAVLADQDPVGVADRLRPRLLARRRRRRRAAQPALERVVIPARRSRVRQVHRRRGVLADARRVAVPVRRALTGARDRAGRHAAGRVRGRAAVVMVVISVRGRGGAAVGPFRALPLRLAVLLLFRMVVSSAAAAATATTATASAAPTTSAATARVLMWRHRPIAVPPAIVRFRMRRGRDEAETVLGTRGRWRGRGGVRRTGVVAFRVRAATVLGRVRRWAVIVFGVATARHVRHQRCEFGSLRAIGHGRAVGRSAVLRRPLHGMIGVYRRPPT